MDILFFILYSPIIQNYLIYFLFHLIFIEKNVKIIKTIKRIFKFQLFFSSKFVYKIYFLILKKFCNEPIELKL